MDKKYLILESGEVFEGTPFGYDGEAVGELVFNTNMVGYIETLTDPSYYGQIIMQTFPLIGNYGIIPADFESDGVNIKAYIVREWCENPSNFRSEGDVDSFLKEHKIPGICGIDTRAITRIVREHGVMNARVSNRPDLTEEEWAELKGFVIKGGVDILSSSEECSLTCENPEFNVVLWDFGAKSNIARELLKRNCNVTIVPSTATAEEILAKSPNGIMLSNGPGDPAENTRIIGEIAKLCTHKIPTFGICLGHQLIALSQGAKTEKLHYGHRGANQPVMDTKTGKVLITSQNHGYAVTSSTLPDTAMVSYVNCNDQSCEGIEYKNMPVFSVQFHPEACAGPLDSEGLFDNFIALMKEGK